MNARDKIKPKSIRLAILEALADGQITTIDDLLLRIEESRKKVVENAGAAANDGLIKRMRDDVTNQAAYQITADGRKYVAKFGDGRRAEPVQAPAPVVQADPVVEIKKTEKLAPQPSQTEVLAQKDVEIASLSRRLRDAFEDVDRLTSELAIAKASLELSKMARAVIHAGYVIQRPVKPLIRVTKIDRARERALSFARGGKKAQVFALVPVGIATPGADWVAA